VTKVCTKCKIEKSLTLFNSRRGKQFHLLHSWCKECEYNGLKNWNLENPNKIREYRAKHRWTFSKRLKRRGITIDGFWKLYDSQNGKCAICLDSIAAENSAIDHNHKTGKIRGILCKNCNRGIGLLKDEAQILNSAYKYLSSAEEK
jgi:hypothetical protein